MRMKSPGGLSGGIGRDCPQSLAHWRLSRAVTWLVATVVTLQTLTRLVLGGTNLCLLNYLYPEHGE